ncbi:molybdenum cofactor guanylyltransferase [Propionibacterium australiense]|nr:NTP transferase domain-containing protein [Propionibacterium australiense]RLP07615.1 molybdenum cofactor guanylyltransferase [Propionibacterium australiense]RLP08375.1 molybdenum cofactor guanylyltransferase [Propionibacterium australiense]
MSTGAGQVAVGRTGAVVHAVVIAGGSGERLGGMSKADIALGGRRLLDLVLDGLDAVVDGALVVVAPGSVQVPEGCRRTLEDPPGGGPLAGVAAGLAALPEAIGQDELVFVCGVDTPAVGALAPPLVRALSRHPGSDGAVPVGGAPEPYRQYLQGLYRRGPLARLLAAAPTRDRGVTRTLRVLDLVEVPVPADVCRDLDSPADLAWWADRLGG